MPSKADHKPTGPLCMKCGLNASRHRAARDRSTYMRGWNRANPRPKASARIIGVDGEGQGRNKHIYNYLAAADEGGKIWTLGHNRVKRLSTEEIFDFLLDLPRHSLVFGFALGYDLTKWCEDLPDVPLYLLFHEKKREYIDYEKGAPVIKTRPVRWLHYTINYRNRRFSLSSGKRSVTVWDVFAFFQSKFTKACIDWKIGNAETVEEMERMKEKRSTFDAQSWEEIQEYCQTECLHLSQLGRQLLDAHEDAGFPLKEYYGAGSTAKALMTKYDVKSFLGDIPEEMREAVACAFFGGRFENSVIGPVRRKVKNADIASAYPYAATFLPCLIHGSWTKVQNPSAGDIQKSTLALINWSLPPLKSSENIHHSWGPLPVRKANGAIAFPLGASSGWTWKEEFLAARKLRQDVHAMHAWLYHSTCQCRPFSFLPGVYLERLRLGKDSRGIVLKLGPNSVYGKLVQSVGFRPPFQCWVWGGNITSSCRAQLLEAIHLASDPSSVLMLATDGVWSDSDIPLPAPKDTGTEEAREFGKPPLGAWEVKDYDNGVFAGRPGIYFPLNPTDDDITKVRARGLGRKILYERHSAVVDAWGRLGAGRHIPDFAAWADDNGELADNFGVRIDGGQRFVGAKTGMSWTKRGGVKRSKDYGEWIDWGSDVGFDPRPKRSGIVPTDFPEESRLTCWDWFEAPSLPYDPAIKTEEDKLLELAQLIAEEQPNADYVEADI